MVELKEMVIETKNIFGEPVKLEFSVDEKLDTFISFGDSKINIKDLEQSLDYAKKLSLV